MKCTSLIMLFAVLLVASSLGHAQAPPRGSGGPGGGGPGFGGPGRTLGQTGKNIKVLNDVPSNQLNTIMDFFSASLGVQCNFCHAMDSAGEHLRPDLDDKGEKKTAREMIQMVMDINAKHFEGHVAVSCFTCHQGNNDPQSTPALPVKAPQEMNEAEWEAKMKAMPKTDQILDMYEKALGGADAIGKVKSWNMKATFNRNGEEQHLELVMAAPHKYAGTVSMGDRGNMTNVYDGNDGWSVGQMGARPMQDMEKVRLSREASMVPVIRLKEMAKDLRMRGTDSINGKPAYVLSARMGDSIRERYYIDSISNLLVRRVVLNKTVVGWVPDQADYSDYKEVEGVKMPWTVTYSYTSPHNSTVRKFSEIKANAPVDSKLFEKPEMKPMQGRPGGGGR